MVILKSALPNSMVVHLIRRWYNREIGIGWWLWICRSTRCTIYMNSGVRGVLSISFHSNTVTCIANELLFWKKKSNLTCIGVLSY